MSDSLVDIGIQLYRIILPVIIIIGIVGNSLNIVVLTRPTLYYHSCSRYFLALAITNLFYSSIIFTYRLLANGYQINLSNNSIVSCKIITYISTTSAFFSPYLIVLASIDRYCASSRSPSMRKFSRAYVAQWMSSIIVVIFSLFFIYILVTANLQPEKGLSCAVQVNSIFSQVYLIIQVSLFAVVPPSLMMIFGLMTIQNANRSRAIQVVASRYNRTEHQLARMLLLQVSVHVFLTLPSSVTYLMAALPNKIQTTSTFSFISIICQLLFNCSYITSFFLYLLSGRIYRKELSQLMYKTFKIRYGNRVKSLTNHNTILSIASLTNPRPAI
ncbi:unnamed protein product [Rotaria sp. Silwood1]|nr:unnamed protein product [Rotaria sp. Silwood1]